MTSLTRSLLPLLGLSVAGCALTDPYQRPGNWYPLGVNDDNLAAMVANPADLMRGTAGGGADGQLAAAAVDRLRHDRVKPLGDSGIADIKPVAGTGSGATGAVGAGSTY